MSEFHKNIFYYFRGANNVKDEDKQFYKETQIEDNTTKALINTLSGSDIHLTELFIKKFADTNIHLSRKDNVRYLLQKHPRNIECKSKKLVIGISPMGSVTLGDKSGDTGRPDGWITGKNFAIAIESKTNIDKIEKYQIKRHCDILNTSYKIATKNESLLRNKWTDVYDFFKKDANVRKICSNHEVTRFLVDQFVKYMEVISLSEFPGFDSYDFVAYLDDTLLDDKQEQKRSTRSKYELLINEVENRLRHIKNLRGIHYELRKGCKAYASSNKKEMENTIHYSFYLDREGFGVDINLPKYSCVRPLFNDLKENSRRLFKLISKQRFVYEITIYDRTLALNRNKGSRAPHTSEWLKILAYKTKHLDRDFYTYERRGNYSKALKRMKKAAVMDRSFLTEDALAKLPDLVEKYQPSISIRKYFPPYYVVKKQENIKIDIVNVVLDLYPLYKYLTGLK